MFHQIPLLLLTATTTATATAVAGVSPSQQNVYLSNAHVSSLDTTTKYTTINCIGTIAEYGNIQKSITAKVNDDYCDCENGLDEPGTSACSHQHITDSFESQNAHSLFYCANLGAHSMNIFKSRVNDGICDCCDGSDETLSTSFSTSTNNPSTSSAANPGAAVCANTCEEDGKSWREEREQRAQEVRKGMAMRETYVELSKAKLNELQEKKNLLQKEVDQLHRTTKSLQDNKLILEERENVTRESQRRAAAIEAAAIEAAKSKESQENNLKLSGIETEVLVRSRILEMLNNPDTPNSKLGLDLLSFAHEQNVLKEFRTFLLKRLPKNANYRDVLPLPVFAAGSAAGSAVDLDEVKKNDIKQELSSLLADTAGSGLTPELDSIRQEAAELLNEINNEDSPNSQNEQISNPETTSTTMHSASSSALASSSPVSTEEAVKELRSLLVSMTDGQFSSQTKLEEGAEDVDKVVEYVHPEAEEARNELMNHEKTIERKEKEINALNSETSSLGSFSQHTKYGKDNAFFTLKDKCITAQFQGYGYEICLFKTAKQGTTIKAIFHNFQIFHNFFNFRRHFFYSFFLFFYIHVLTMQSNCFAVGHTRLGDWDDSFWSRNVFDDGSPLKAKFINGKRCYNGPSRTMELLFICGKISNKKKFK